MAATNDITGDAIATKAASEAYRANYDAIFGKKKQSAAEPAPELSLNRFRDNRAEPAPEPTRSAPGARA